MTIFDQILSSFFASAPSAVVIICMLFLDFSCAHSLHVVVQHCFFLCVCGSRRHYDHPLPKIRPAPCSDRPDCIAERTEPTPAMAATPSARQARKIRNPFNPPRNSRRANLAAVDRLIPQPRPVSASRQYDHRSDGSRGRIWTQVLGYVSPVPALRRACPASQKAVP